MGHICLAIDEDAMSYPSKENYFSPSITYPEYIWKQELCNTSNKVYDLLRKCFYASGYDQNNYGRPEWNPLGHIIKPGHTVLVKPNWVEDKNKNKNLEDPFSCLVTHPSVLRAIIDYIVIALHGEGKIIVGDAPMQGCDLPRLLMLTGYMDLFAFYRNHGIEIEIADLRKYHVSGKYNGVLTKPEYTKNTLGSCRVALGQQSMHSEKDANNPKYKVSDYKCKDTREYHHKNCHDYQINQIALNADVIVNVPKPKTHRLAGMTAASKNFVGTIYEKACLPHRMEGDKAHGGDAYQKKSIWKEWMSRFDEKRTAFAIEGKYIRSKWNDIIMKSCYTIGTFTSHDKYRIGSWYGNDTIWRTVADINYCLLYADKQGNICNKPQRTILSIGDMVICGEKEGPVGPSPKPLGMIMMADNVLLFDRVMYEIMGFSTHCFPLFCNPRALEMLGYQSLEALEQEKICILENEMSKKCIAEFKGRDNWKFEAHSCWKGHIEKNT